MQKILVADDSAVQRKMIIQIIRKAGFENEVIEACDGKDAIGKLAANLSSVCLIMSDWNMPNMSGIEFLEAIAKVPQVAKMPVVMVTTEGTESKIKEAHEKFPSLAGYITKPFTPDQLKVKIEQFLAPK